MSNMGTSTDDRHRRISKTQWHYLVRSYGTQLRSVKHKTNCTGTWAQQQDLSFLIDWVEKT